METAALVALALSTLLTLAGALGGFILKHVFDRIRELQDRCARQEQSLAEQAQRVAENYLRREDCHRQSDTVLDQLGKIESKLDRVIERIGGMA